MTALLSSPLPSCAVLSLSLASQRSVLALHRLKLRRARFDSTFLLEPPCRRPTNPSPFACRRTGPSACSSGPFTPSPWPGSATSALPRSWRERALSCWTSRPENARRTPHHASHENVGGGSRTHCGLARQVDEGSWPSTFHLFTISVVFEQRPGRLPRTDAVGTSNGTVGIAES